MYDPVAIARRIQEIGFRCTGCGRCCAQIERDSNLVIAGADEIRDIIAGTSLDWQDIAEPYPEIIDDGANHIFTIGWCIRRYKNECKFLKSFRCEIYPYRPWICRTYPFSLAENDIQVSQCPGIGSEIAWEDACDLAKMLIQRWSAESLEEKRIRTILQKNQLPEGFFVIIDSEGIKKWRL